MLKSLCTLTFIAIFSFSYMVESIALNLEQDDHHFEVSQLDSEHNHDLVVGDLHQGNDCSDCDNNSCNTTSGHCSHHCGGIHNISITSNFRILTKPTHNSFKLLWYYHSNYTSPTLNPGLKPPRLS